MSLAVLILVADSCLLAGALLVALAVRLVAARTPARRPRRAAHMSRAQRRLLAERHRHHDPEVTDVLPRLNPDGTPARLPTDHDP